MTQSISRTDLEAAIKEGTVTVVDALGGEYWAKQHLPGAIPLVAADVPAQAATLLPNPDAPIVTYCSNAACPNSGQVAALLEGLGYTNVRKYREGIEDWSDAGLPLESTTN
jgi:rhodanese-related sulfurtransferase